MGLRYGWANHGQIRGECVGAVGVMDRYTCAIEYTAAVLKYNKRMARSTQAQDEEIRALCKKYGRVNVYK